MSGGTRRVLAACLTAVALTAGAVGCTSGSGERDGSGSAADSRGGGARPAAAAEACADGTFTWFNIVKPTRLLGVSEPEDVGKGGGRLTKKVQRVSTVEISVRPEGALPAPEEALFSLGREIGEIDSDAPTLKEVTGESWSFTQVGNRGPRLREGFARVDGPGRFVQYSAVRTVEADFRHTCAGGRTTLGHAESWTVAVSGVVECGTRADDGTGDGTDDVTARQAARLACGTDSAAAKP
ncbi:hypothetical protein ACFYNZ_07785 [Streptomyces kebangsaanensis]|uniref:Lipoprotein n=1 Tax=Streptomyces kebangsaanensis TaxID=864058 RepID=A0ABW6KPR3_9ACTN